MFHYLQKKQHYFLRIVKDFSNPAYFPHKHRRPEKATWKPKLFTSQFSESFMEEKNHSDTNRNADLGGQALSRQSVLQAEDHACHFQHN